jgi:transposase
LACDRGVAEGVIAETLPCGTSTIYRTKKRLVEEGLDAALNDYEYRRNGTANLFVFVDAHRPWRHVKGTERRTNTDFAYCMRELVDLHYPHASLIRVVLDNLSTHRAKNLYEAFEPAEARRVLRRREFHYTPKHASWLNMVEIEISVLSRQCLCRRIPSMQELRREVAAWKRDRDATGERIKWMFDIDKARRKLGPSYPDPPDAAVPVAA